jgi:hypothetical protein|tara:strand:- start:280 stop:567 length:288 start_codon:yes stop_codon:yes gene_type:complete
MSISRLFYDKDKGQNHWGGEAFHGVMIDEKRVDVVCVGMDCVDSTLKDAYDNVNELPEWVQLKIAVLMACQDGHTIDTIGRRVDESTFWIYGGEE